MEFGHPLTRVSRGHHAKCGGTRAFDTCLGLPRFRAVAGATQVSKQQRFKSQMMRAFLPLVRIVFRHSKPMKILFSLLLTFAMATPVLAQGKVRLVNDSLHLVYFNPNTAFLLPGDAALAGQAYALGS